MIGRALFLSFLLLAAIGGAGGLRAQIEEPRPGRPVPPAVQTQVEDWQRRAAALAAEAELIDATAVQNRRGPIPGMDNARWKALRRRSPEVQAFQESVAGKRLAAWLKESRGCAVEAFLNGSRGEKVAFAEKPTSYLHAGREKFDVPFRTGKPWQGAMSFDESSQAYVIQVGVPVFGPGVGGAPGPVTGVLVVSLDIGMLEAQARPPAPSAPGEGK